MHTYLSYVPRIRSGRKEHSNFFSHIGSVYRKPISKNKKSVAHDNKTPTKIRMMDAFLLTLMFHGCHFYLRKAPKCNKYAVQSTSAKGRENGNSGSATVEAVCIMPLLIFAFWAFYSIGQLYILENQVYQAAINTAGGLAEYAYLTERNEQLSDPEDSEAISLQLLGTGIAETKFRSYLEERRRIERYVINGIGGFQFADVQIPDTEGFICFQIQYRVRIPVPFLANLTMPLSVQIRQKAFTGYRNGDGQEQEVYVYVAEYSTVYHVSRNCTHLRLTIIPVTEAVLKTGYSNLSPCELCGSEKANLYFVTETGDRYHTSDRCTGLKRTVRRVKLKELNGYAPCSRCGGDRS